MLRLRTTDEKGEKRVEREKRKTDLAVALSYGCIERRNWYITSPAQWFSSTCATLNPQANCMAKYSGRQSPAPLRHSRVQCKQCDGAGQQHLPVKQLIDSTCPYYNQMLYDILPPCLSSGTALFIPACLVALAFALAAGVHLWNYTHQQITSAF